VGSVTAGDRRGAEVNDAVDCGRQPCGGRSPMKTKKKTFRKKTLRKPITARKLSKAELRVYRNIIA
jgi:hypothetical protein